ncbi:MULTISPECIES: ABC transporter substrate-binding protein [Methylobacterium]|jgi:glycerol transport system substrate-binding protein|uniref:ABC transporter substrate-binding protein n=1 Tax=Methylobacterium TaxID=407 RepID=UPI0008F0ABB8|nr:MULTISPECIES: ABC transporter substrate-binding protein [Methylobacterium]MBK3398794.1 carbohydrate ABC transporter substrate-binding protein [Methylobacterium ajmalii]MBK3410980.1 carbohydrate ABC transporter substrate-binding protein [Methylobacterium ajmalii]MBK3424762.1 carbohydrate ABC transporter substrate-binding protein [Methylobacterium ajmalii]MBZ6411316.1 ABC transporter substrate-binding protein [Methylobacterium sp.]SFE14712.1 glycerol transport system substrate-binding protein
MKRHTLLTAASALALSLAAGHAFAGMEEAKRWVDTEFQPSTLSKEEQLKEMQWFIDAAKPFAGMEINFVSETITTHEYEARTLAKAFSEITGIKVRHDLLQEGDVVEKIQTQMQSGKNIYDGWINDSDLVGTHFRYGQTVALSDFMTGEAKDVTSPTLDLDDFIGKSFGTGPDNKLYQLPDQQFANLYWFRYDWFTRADLKQKFKAKYGYELGVPVNWSAYEDIAEFFTNDVKEIDGVKVYGHMDYGKKDPSLGWRFTDAWLSMAGNGDKGLPNGKPVDEWGIRMEGCRPVGSSIERGGDTNGPAAVYSVTKYVEWLKKYAPPQAAGMTFSESGPVPSQGNVAQQMFWYTAFTADMVKPGLPVMNQDGTPKWRMAPSPKGPYWKEGMKLGYQDAGSLTLLKSTPLERRKAAWLYQQFIVSKSVSLKKSHVGLTFIRESDIWDKSFTERAPKLGGLVEFYRSPARTQWTPTGVNVPDYPKLAQLWWQNIGDASSGAKTPQAAMDALANAQDDVMARLERSKVQGECGPKLNPKTSAEHWYEQAKKDGTLAPQRKLADEKPKGETIDYDTLIKSWPASPPKRG